MGERVFLNMFAMAGTQVVVNLETRFTNYVTKSEDVMLVRFFDACEVSFHLCFLCLFVAMSLLIACGPKACLQSGLRHISFARGGRFFGLRRSTLRLHTG